MKALRMQRLSAIAALVAIGFAGRAAAQTAAGGTENSPDYYLQDFNDPAAAEAAVEEMSGLKAYDGYLGAPAAEGGFAIYRVSELLPRLRPGQKVRLVYTGAAVGAPENVFVSWSTAAAKQADNWKDISINEFEIPLRFQPATYLRVRIVRRQTDPANPLYACCGSFSLRAEPPFPDTRTTFYKYETGDGEKYLKDAVSIRNIKLFPEIGLSSADQAGGHIVYDLKELLPGRRPGDKIMLEYKGAGRDSGNQVIGVHCESSPDGKSYQEFSAAEYGKPVQVPGRFLRFRIAWQQTASAHYGHLTGFIVKTVTP